jgi:hypothetical protein
MEEEGIPSHFGIREKFAGQLHDPSEQFLIFPCSILMGNGQV